MKFIGFIIALGEMLSCPAICFNSNRWKMKKISCEESKAYTCEIALSTFKKAPVMPSIPEKPKKRVVRRTRKSAFITGKAIAIKRLSMVTMCSRVCIETSRCTVFNYNSVTNQCKTFQQFQDQSVMFEVREYWDVWEVLYQ